MVLEKDQITELIRFLGCSGFDTLGACVVELATARRTPTPGTGIIRQNNASIKLGKD